MAKYLPLVFALITYFNSFAQTDTDHDMIADQWEIEHGLSIDDEQDAYQDPDGDHIINLFEYQLGSDPMDPNSPSIVNHNLESDLGSALSNVSAGTVLRLSEGTHSIEWLKFFREDINVMIQGGWSSDFSEYDPLTHKTILFGGNLTVFNIAFMSGSQNVFIVEGVASKNNKDLFSPFEIAFSDSSSTFFALHNSSVTGMQTGMKLSHYDKATSQISISKSYFIENQGNGIEINVSEEVESEAKILNNTIAANRVNSSGFFSGFGLDITTLNTASIALDVRNNIIWGNDKGSIEVSGFGNPVEFSQFNYNVIGGEIEQFGEVLIPDACCQIFEDPAFIENSFRLSSNSICIDNGMILGFDYMGNGLDIGANEFNPMTTETKFYELNQNIITYPNPTVAGIQVLIHDPFIKEVQVEVFDLSGKLLLRQQESISETPIEVDLSQLPAGQYPVKLHTDRGVVSKIIQKL